jgi:hypothetical protein
MPLGGDGLCVVGRTSSPISSSLVVNAIEDGENWMGKLFSL